MTPNSERGLARGLAIADDVLFLRLRVSWPRVSVPVQSVGFFVFAFDPPGLMAVVGPLCGGRIPLFSSGLRQLQSDV